MAQLISPTIKEVARNAGVSVATVSYVINDGPRPVSEETRQRVLEAMQRIGYHPNISARRLRLQRTNVIGLAIAGSSGLSPLVDPYYLDIMRGVGDAIDHHDYDLLLFSSNRKLQSLEFYHSLAGQRMVDGVILTGSLINPDGLAHLKKAGFPTVIIGRQLRELHFVRIAFSYEQDAFNSTMTLLNQGHTRIGLLRNLGSLDTEIKRLHGYQRALQAHGIAIDPALVWTPEVLEAHPPFEAVHGLVLNQHATALICGSQYLEVCRYLDNLGAAAEHVVVATLDEKTFVARPARVVAGIQLPKYQAALAAVDVLIQQINQQPTVDEETVLSAELRLYS